MRFEPVELEGGHVRLEPLSERHRQGLCDAIADGELWNLFVTSVPHPSRIDEFLNNAREAYESGDGLAFATIDRATGRVAGSTRFMRASPANRRVEIGHTFLGNAWRRTGANTEAKLLMLTHAFDALDLNRVEFLTDYLNDRSRRAILRLGAKEEGILRCHMVMPNGRVRDSVLYSIVRSEWPGIKQHLCAKLAARAANRNA